MTLNYTQVFFYHLVLDLGQFWTKFENYKNAMDGTESATSREYANSIFFDEYSNWWVLTFDHGRSQWISFGFVTSIWKHAWILGIIDWNHITEIHRLIHIICQDCHMAIIWYDIYRISRCITKKVNFLRTRKNLRL